LHRSSEFVLLFLVALSWAPSPSSAQIAPALRLTLTDAITIALKENPQVQNANLDVADRQQDVHLRRSALLPQATLEVSDRAERINLGSTFGANLPIFPHHVGPFQVFQAGPEFSTSVFDLTLWRRLQASRASLEGARNDARSLRDQTTLLVVSQYLAALRAGEQLKAAQSRVDLAQALFDQAVQLEQHGIGTNLDTVRAQVELQNEKQSLLVEQSERLKALYGLGRLLDLAPQQPIELTDQSLFSQTPEFPGDASVAGALANRPEMKSLDVQLVAAGYDRRAAREERLPSFSLGGNWAYEGASLPTSIPTYAMGATLSVPLWTGGRIRAEEAKADLALRHLENQRRGERDAIAEEVKSATADLESARSQVEVARSGLVLAQKALDQARERFAAGIANNLEVVTAQDSLARASDNLIDALYRYNLAHAQLAHAMGQIEALYAK
jgi:outer membrane protein TolC